MTMLVRASLLALLVTAGGSAAVAQSTAPAPSSGIADTGNPRADNWRRMQRKISIELTDARLEDAVRFLTDYTSADIEMHWADSASTGLDKDQRINVTVREQPALMLLERLLEKAQGDFDENTWQFTSAGTIEAGPKSMLNKSKKLKIYDIHDMLFVIPNFEEVPELDVDSVLQQGQNGGGGGSSSIFQDNEDDEDENRVTDEENAQKIIDIIVENIEPEQWQDNGGDGASVRFHNGTLLIRAPEYIHRQLEPEAFMSAAGAKRTPATGGRTVSNRGNTTSAPADTARSAPPATAAPAAKPAKPATAPATGAKPAGG